MPKIDEDKFTSKHLDNVVDPLVKSETKNSEPEITEFLRNNFVRGERTDMIKKEEVVQLYKISNPNDYRNDHVLKTNIGKIAKMEFGVESSRPGRFGD